MKRLRWNSPLVITLVSALAIIVANWASLFLYWYSPFVQGWDGQGMASAAQYYAAHIFPSFWGWISSWCAGMPFPQFYPPMFFFILAALSKITPFLSFTILFKLFVTVLQLAVPGVLVYFVSARTKNSLALWLTAISAVFLTSAYFPDIGSSGVTIESTIHTGMVAQLLSFIFIIGWLHFFLKIESNVRARYWAGLLLFLAFLSNGHDDIVLFFIFVTVYLVSLIILWRKVRHEETLEKMKFLGKHFLLYFLSGLLPLLATAVWSLSLVFNYQYLTTSPVLSLPTLWECFKSDSIIWLVPVIGALVALKFRRKDLIAISVSSLVVLVVIFDPGGVLSSGLPAAPNRWFVIPCFFVPLIIGLLFEDVCKLFKLEKKGRRGSAFLIVIAILFLGSGSYDYSTLGGYYLDYQADHFSDILSYMQTNGKALGMTVDEAVETQYSPTLFIFDSTFGPLDGGAPVFDMRESSINSIYMTPIRNQLSSGQDVWGFSTYLGSDPQFISQNIDEALDHAQYAGIQSFLVRSSYMKTRLAKDPRVALVKDFGNWQIWSFKQTVPRATDLSRQPILFYGDLTFKNRGIDGYDWSRFQEEQMFEDASDTEFIYSPDQNIDTSADFGKASTTLVAAYVYKNIDTAYARLKQYAKGNDLVLVADQDPLFQKMEKLYETSSTTGVYHIQLVDHLTSTVLNPDPVRLQFADLFTSIRKTNPLLVNPIYPVSSTFGDNKIHVQMSGTSTVAVPVLVKGSYFPAWKRTDGAPVYLASPGFMLTYATSTFDIVFTTPWYVYAGCIITIAVLAGVVAVILLLKFRNREY